VRLHGGKRGIEAATAEGRDLLQQPRRQHGIEPGVDAAVELRTLDIEEDLDRARRIERGLHALRVPIRERTAGREHDFERAGHAGAVPRH
jgi:hypothetical protein